MKVVVQRARQASVTVEGEVVGQIESGYVLLVGVTHTDTERDVAYVANKIAGLRLFEDEHGQMNVSIQDVGGSILSISQFTLYGSTKSGRRPSFIQAARPEVAEPLWELLNERLRTEHQLHVETGTFGAMMDVTLTNDGPVTVIIETEDGKGIA